MRSDLENTSAELEAGCALPRDAANCQRHASAMHEAIGADSAEARAALTCLRAWSPHLPWTCPTECALARLRCEKSCAAFAPVRLEDVQALEYFC